MSDIRINQLPLATGPTAPMQSDVLPIDGTSTRKATLLSLADAINPPASQAEAEAGTDAVKRMTPLTTKQQIDSRIGTASGTIAAGDDPRFDLAETAADFFVYDDVRWYGYVADGNSHPLSSVVFFKGLITSGWTLSQWQTAVPEVDSLSNEIDRIAIQAFCNDRPVRVDLNLPAGVAIIDKGIKTTANQNVCIRTPGRDLVKFKYYEASGIMWRHGGIADEPAANGGFQCDTGITIQPMAVSHCAFWIRYSGSQPAYATKIEHVLINAEDTTSYFQQPFRIWNIKRGCTIRNCAIYGRHFFILGTDAITMEPNAGVNCPPGQQNLVATNTLDIYNFMSVGYRSTVTMNYDGFTSSSAHCHEEGQFWNLQGYACVTLFRAINTNTNYAPSDNWTLTCCGWQGLGPALNIQYLEHVRVRDTLFVNDVVTDASVANYFNIIDCKSVIIDANEFFIVYPESVTFTPCYIGGTGTYNVKFLNNDIVHFDDVLTSFITIDANVPEGGFEERGNRFRGTGTYTNGKIYDLSNKAVSEQRAKDIVASTGDGLGSVNVDTDGKITWSDIFTTTTSDNFGNTLITYPASLFRNGIVSVQVSNANVSKTVAAPTNAPGNTGGAVVRYPHNTSPGSVTPGLPSGSSVDTAVTVKGY